MRRSFVPQVGDACRLLDCDLSAYDLTLCAYETTPRTSLKRALSYCHAPKSLAILIGPEGGFASYEIEALCQRGVVPVSLGPRICAPKRRRRRCWPPYCIITDSGRISMKVAFLYPGLKVNQYDSQAMAGYLQRAGHTIVPFDGPADAYVINSCTVTAESDRKTRQAIGKAKSTTPTPFVCVGGLLCPARSPCALAARAMWTRCWARGMAAHRRGVGKRPARAKAGCCGAIPRLGPL